MNLKQLPSTFYRVSLKAVVLDDQNRMLVGQAKDGVWETPGGGWEYNETFEECLRREIREELGVEIDNVGSLLFPFKGKNPKGYMVVYLAFLVKLKSYDFKLIDEL